MDSVHAHPARLHFDKSNCLAAISAAAEGFVNEQLVDKCIVAVEFKTEAQRQHNVTDRPVPFAEKPSFSECRKRQEPPEGLASRGLVKLNLSRLLLGKKAHHAKEFYLVVKRCFPDHELRQVTHRFVR